MRSGFVSARRPGRWLLSTVVFLLALLPAAAAGLLLALFLVGPHSDLLPATLRAPVGIAIWALVLGLPAWFAWRTFIGHGPRRE